MNRNQGLSVSAKIIFNFLQCWDINYDIFQCDRCRRMRPSEAKEPRKIAILADLEKTTPFEEIHVLITYVVQYELYIHL